jgi:hypothetical protein
MSDYFTFSQDPANDSDGDSSVIRAVFTEIEAGFAKIASYTGAANRVLHINAGATASTTTAGFTFDGTTFTAPALAVTNNATITGDLAVNGGDLTSTSATFNLLAASTTVVIGAAATTASIGAATGTLTVNNTTLAAKAGTFSTTLSCAGDFAVASTKFTVNATSGVASFSGNLTVGGTLGVTGIATFTASPVGPVPTTSTQLATKGYVDGVGMSAALPNQAGNAGKYVTTDGATASWGANITASISRSARTSNTILAAADTTKLIDITSGSFTQTFTAAATLGDGWYAYLRNSGTGTVELDLSATSGGSNLVNTNAFTVAGTPTDMIVNGGFGADTDWTKGTNWTISAGTAVATATTSGITLAPTAALSITVGHTYILTFDVTASINNVNAILGGVTSTNKTTGSYVETVVTTTTGNLTFQRGSGSFTGTVDNVTCKDLSGRWMYQGTDLAVNGTFAADTDWTKGGGWTIAGGVAVATATGNTITPSAATFITAGHFYSVTYDVVVTSGSVRVQLGGNNGYTHGVSGTYCDVLYATDTTKPAFDGVGTFTGTLDNVVIRDLSSATDQGFGIATWFGDTTASAVQTISALTSGATYKLTYTVGVGTGGVAPYIGSQQLPRRYVSGTYTEYIVASAAHTTMGFYCNSLDVPFNGSVSAVSLNRCSDQVLLPGEMVAVQSDASTLRAIRMDENGSLARVSNDSVTAAMTANTWTTATLNTVVQDQHGFTALNTSNQLVLPAGRYNVEGVVYASGTNAIARLYNSTAGTALLHSTTSGTSLLNAISGDFTLTAQSTLVLQINCTSGNDGIAITTTSDRPFYRNTMLSIWKRG